MKKNPPVHIPRSMTNQEFDPRIPPAVVVEPGQTVWLETQDCWKGSVTRYHKADGKTYRADLGIPPGMPLTGPVGLHGACPGDTLMVEILQVQVAAAGWTMTSNGRGAMGDILPWGENRRMAVQGRSARFEDLYTVPVSPMIGCIGTTPLQSLSASWPGSHGGNLDCKDIKAGSTLFLPVYVDGANLALGDLHAAQGDGEVSGTAIEIEGRVKIRLRLLRGANFQLPLLQTRRSLAAISTQPTLDEAAKKAAEGLALFLSSCSEHTLLNIAMLLSLVGDICICQMVNPAMTCRMEISRQFIEKELGIDLKALWEKYEVK